MSGSLSDDEMRLRLTGIAPDFSSGNLDLDTESIGEIHLSIKPKEGKEIDKNEIEKCLEYTVERASSKLK